MCIFLSDPTQLLLSEGVGSIQYNYYQITLLLTARWASNQSFVWGGGG